MAAEPMNKSQIAEHLAKAVGITKKQAAEALDEIANLVYKEAKKTITFPGLGKFSVVPTKARKGRNPHTGAALKIPAGKALRFKISQTAKNAVLPKKK